MVSASEGALEAKATGASSWRQAAPSPLLDGSTDNTTGFPVSKNFSTGAFVRSSFSLSNVGFSPIPDDIVVEKLSQCGCCCCCCFVLFFVFSQ